MIFGGVGVFLIFGLWLWSLGDEYIWIFLVATLSVYIYLYLPIFGDFFGQFVICYIYEIGRACFIWILIGQLFLEI